MRGFTQEERAAINKISQGGPLDNSLRYLGKLAPTGIVSGVGSAVAGGAVGGIPGAVATMSGGALARYLATKSTQGRVTKASEIVRRGNQPPLMTTIPGRPNLTPFALPSEQQKRQLFPLLTVSQEEH